MPKHSKKNDSSSDSDEGPVDRNPPPSKKAKTSGESSGSSGTWDLGNKRKVTVREFKGKVYVDIREFYLDKDGEEKPGKKGISLGAAQFKKLTEILSEVEDELKKH